MPNAFPLMQRGALTMSLRLSHYRSTPPLLRPRKLSQAKQTPLYPGMYRDVRRFEGEYVYDYGRHTFTMLREGTPFAVLPIGCALALAASYHPALAALPLSVSSMYLVALLLLSRWVAKGRRNRVWRDLTGRHVLITGGTSGIGRETAAQLAKMGADLTVLSRDGPHVSAAMAHICRGAPHASQRITFAALDLTDLAAVRDFCKRARQQHVEVDILVNNAGVLHPTQVMSRYGEDAQLAVNLLAPYLLTEGLMPLVAERGGRVVYVACSAHVGVKGNIVATYLSGRGVWSPRVRDRFDGLEQYGFTKLGCIYHAQDLAARSYEEVAPSSIGTRGVVTPFAKKPMEESLSRYNKNSSGQQGDHKTNQDGVGMMGNSHGPRYTACVAVPGGVLTSIYRHVPLAATFRWGRYMYLLFMRTAYEGSQTVVNCCVREELVNGGYYQDCRYMPSGLSAAACNVEERKSVLAWVKKKMQPYMRWEN